MKERDIPSRFLEGDKNVVTPYRLTPQLAFRVSILGVVTLLLFGVLFLRLWSLQIISGPSYRQAASENRQRSSFVEAPRGPILDRAGRILVDNAPATLVQVWPSNLPGRAARERELRRLATVLGLQATEVIRAVAVGDKSPSLPVVVARRVQRPVINYLLERQPEFPGVQLLDTFERRYPRGETAAHLLGYVGPITEAQLRASKGTLHFGDQVGQAGIELRYDSLVRGRDGLASLGVDSLGRPRGQTRLSRLAIGGNALRLTIDLRVQRAAEEALRQGIASARGNKNWFANGGAIVALDPRDGSVIALASNPIYSPGAFNDRRASGRLASLLDPARAAADNYPLIDRARQGLYPPGSTFKPVTALAAIAEGLLNPYAPRPCTSQVVIAGQVFRNWRPDVDTQMTLPQALAASCDTYFYRLGKAFYDLPANRGQPLQAWARRFGFGAPTGIDLGGEQAGLVPTIGWRHRTYTRRSDRCCWQIDRLWKPGDSVQLAIGQKDLLVTPLQMARFYALLANGGRLVTPHLLADIEMPGSSSAATRRVLQGANVPAPRPVGLSDGALAAVRQGLVEATHSSIGTSSGVFGTFPVRIAGKTGTAEKVVRVAGSSRLLSQSWWCGYGPSESARLVVCAVIENGGFGGEAAAPAALRVFESFFRTKAALTSVVPSD